MVNQVTRSIITFLQSYIPVSERITSLDEKSGDSPSAAMRGEPSSKGSNPADLARWNRTTWRPPLLLMALLASFTIQVNTSAASEPLPKGTLRAGIIGCDTSHVPAFATLLNAERSGGDPLSGVRVVAAFPGGSDDIASSRDRVEGFTEQLREMGIEIVPTIAELLERVDVVLLESSDGRKHLEQVRPVIEAGKPVFVDKPFAASVADAEEIFSLAKKHNVPIFSSSMMRFAPEIAAANSDPAIGDIVGCDAYSPCTLDATHSDLFWYGIHGVETLFTVMGPGCESVSRTHTEGTELVTGVWKDGRIGSFRGIRDGKRSFGALVLGSKGIKHLKRTGSYDPLVAEIVKFFKSGKPPVSASETLEILAFMEAAELSKTESGRSVALQEVLSGALAQQPDKAAHLQRRPNILLIVSDDQRADTIAAMGNEAIRTPNLDALAVRGSLFTRASCANPICTPSRGEILTGCNGFNNGVMDFGQHFRDGLTPIAAALSDAGYRTCYVGKWHNAGRPSQYGYQESKGLFMGGGGKFWKPQLDAHGRDVTGYRGWVFQSAAGELSPELGVGLTPDISQRFADAAIEAVSEPGDAPFFVHVNFTAPHDPLLMPTGYENAYDPDKIPFPKNFLAAHPFETGNLGGRDEVLLPTPRTEKDVREDIAVYYAVIAHMDEQIGRILASLDASGQQDNTIVIFTSDHGVALGSHGLRGKQNMYEHTVNVPMLMRGPSIPVGKTFAAQMYLRDLYPTICDWAGVPLPNEIDGRSVVPILRGAATTIHDYTFGYFRNFQRMIRGDRWKLIQYPQIDHWQLFDLVSDPEEQHSLADDPKHAEIKRELQSRLRAWQQQVGDPLL